MKRVLLFLWILALLAGCSGVPDDTTPSTQPTVEPGIYEPNHPLENQSSGAVRVFPLEEDCAGIAFMGKTLVTFAVEEDTTALTPYTGQNLTRQQGTVLNDSVLPSSKNARFDQQRFGYYNRAERSVVFLDSGLQETGRIRMPQDMVGEPVISETMAAVFYCTSSEVRTLSLESGINRLIRQQNAQALSVEAALFADTVLMCDVTDLDGNRYMEFISAETGETLGVDRSFVKLDVWKNQYFLQRLDGLVTEYIFTDTDGSQKCFIPTDSGYGVHILMEMNAVATSVKEDDSVKIQLFDLADGKQLAQITLQGVSEISGLICDPEQDTVWFLAEDAASQKTLLCGWDFEKSSVTDDTVYTSPRYTAQNPDTAGLDACRKLADTLQERYGVQIFLADTPLGSADYALIYEHQPTVIRAALEQLEQAMAAFPEDFLRTAADVSDSKQLHIGLVRGLKSKHTGVPDGIAAAQYWVEGNAWMALSVGDDVQQLFYHELAHLLDTFVYSQNVAYDEWSKLNPADFTYDLSYTQYENREESPYLSGSSRAFVDSYSMTFPKEDRARIFDCAMAEGNAELFSSKTMQSKLRQLCVGIRNAFGWKKDERAFIWEQYLETPLAYNKK